MSWFNDIRKDISNIIPAIDYYEKELDEARKECGLKGSVERHSRDMPGIIEYRFNQLQEIEAILEYLNIELRKIKTQKYKNFKSLVPKNDSLFSFVFANIKPNNIESYFSKLSKAILAFLNEPKSKYTLAKAAYKIAFCAGAILLKCNPF